MSNIIIFTIVSLSVLGLVLAMVLYLVAKKFKVEEDPRIDQVEAILPAANCGGCGLAGCRAFAEAVVKAPTLDNLNCPVGGNSVMKAIADAMGYVVEEKAPQVAVLKCNGSCEKRPKLLQYNGAASCKVQTALYPGDTGCSFGCLGSGDCAVACSFGAITINPETQLPEVDEDLCVACAACVKACPKGIFELRNKGPKSRRVYVACSNKDKGGVARKACQVACIGCMKCMKECPFEAIKIENFLSYIDYQKCKLCRKCVDVCPTNAIIALNFPVKKVENVEKSSVA